MGTVRFFNISLRLYLTHALAIWFIASLWNSNGAHLWPLFMLVAPFVYYGITIALKLFIKLWWIGFLQKEDMPKESLETELYGYSLPLQTIHLVAVFILAAFVNLSGQGTISFLTGLLSGFLFIQLLVLIQVLKNMFKAFLDFLC